MRRPARGRAGRRKARLARTQRLDVHGKTTVVTGAPRHGRRVATDAAARIVDATVRRRPRTMIGRESRLVDVLVRLAPMRYWAVMRRPLRDAIDTTTPVG